MGADTIFFKIYISETFKEVEKWMNFLRSLATTLLGRHES
jgi:hypothetical protein